MSVSSTAQTFIGVPNILKITKVILHRIPFSFGNKRVEVSLYPDKGVADLTTICANKIFQMVDRYKENIQLEPQKILPFSTLFNRIQMLAEVVEDLFTSEEYKREKLFVKYKTDLKSKLPVHLHGVIEGRSLYLGYRSGIDRRDYFDVTVLCGQEVLFRDLAIEVNRLIGEKLQKPISEDSRWTVSFWHCYKPYEKEVTYGSTEPLSSLTRVESYWKIVNVRFFPSENN